MERLKFLILPLLLGIQFTCISQSGFRVIEKAEKIYKQGDFNKSLKLLKRAEKMDYGFCGNAHIEAEIEIHTLRSEIYLKTKNYKLARASLDSIISFGERRDIDSIKVRTYQDELGADYLKNVIDDSLNDSFVDCNNNDCYGIIPLMNKETSLKFKIYGDYLVYMFEKDLNKRNNMWVQKFFKSNSYKLIKKESR